MSLPAQPIDYASAATVLAVFALVMSLRSSVTGRSYWSTPGAAGVRALQFLATLWPPVLIMLLTLPPLARRMARRG